MASVPSGLMESASERGAPGSLYFAMTPYHVILAAGIALKDTALRKHHLILALDFTEPGRLVEALADWRDSPFDSMAILNGRYDASSVVVRAFTIGMNSRKIRRLLRTLEFDHLFVFNDARAETQSALSWAKAQRSPARAICVEDGTAMYASTSIPRRHGGHLRLARRLIYGSWWHEVGVLGTSPWIDEIRLLAPEYARPELQRYALIGLELPLTSPAMQTLARAYVKAYPESDGLAGIQALVVLSHSEAVRNTILYSEMIKYICVEAQNQGLVVAIKHHPRETNRDPFDLAGDGRIRQLPRSLATEFLLLGAAPRLRLIIGDSSTALLTACRGPTQPQVVSIAPLIEEGIVLAAVFAGLGVKLVSSKIELSEVLRLCSMGTKE